MMPMLKGNQEGGREEEEEGRRKGGRTGRRKGGRDRVKNWKYDAYAQRY
jgi:hypothetical protein